MHWAPRRLEGSVWASEKAPYRRSRVMFSVAIQEALLPAVVLVLCHFYPSAPRRHCTWWPLALPAPGLPFPLAPRPPLTAWRLLAARRHAPSLMSPEVNTRYCPVYLEDLQYPKTPVFSDPSSGGTLAGILASQISSHL